jgi:hypothetical protein
MDRNLDHEVNLASSKAAEAGWSPAATEGAEEALGAPVVEQCYQCGCECRRVGETSRQLVVGGGDPRVLNGKRRANADLGSTGLWRRLVAFGDEGQDQRTNCASPKRGLGPE